MSSYWDDRWTQNSGVLSGMVQQPVDNAIQVSWDNGATYTERWKGPYSAMKGVTSAGGTVMGRNFIVGQALPDIPSEGKWHSLIGAPSPLSGMKWMVDTVTATELEAGDHGLLEITYKAVPATLLPMGGYGTIPASADASVSVKVVTENSGWTLRWGTYSRNVLEYCDSWEGAGSVVADDVAHADHIIKCAQLPKPRTSQIPENWRGNPTDHPPQYMWVEPNQAGESVSADVKELCHSQGGTVFKERQIYNYYVRGVQPVFHYPILTYSETWEMPLDRLSAIQTQHALPVGAGTTDTIVDWTQDPDLKECPFDLGDDWQFIDCGTECTTRESTSIEKSTFQVTWTTTWEGCVSADANFYSAEKNKRWFPGGGTWADHYPNSEEDDNEETP